MPRQRGTRLRETQAIQRTRILSLARPQRPMAHLQTKRHRNRINPRVTARRLGVEESPVMRIAIGSDHAGFGLKAVLVAHLTAAGHDVTDFGTDSSKPVDYGPICARVARSVVAGDADRGIVLGGSGQGEQIAANKVNGARAALCHDLWMAIKSREHNDANVLSMGSRVVADEMAVEIVDVWLATDFEGGRHQRRVEQLGDIEASNVP